jgi:hypothetical protein
MIQKDVFLKQTELKTLITKILHYFYNLLITSEELKNLTTLEQLEEIKLN